MPNIRWSKEVKFKPWVQKPYWNSSVHTLFLGDSHYGANPLDATPNFTNKIVQKSIANSLAFFTKTAGIITNNRLDDPASRKQFWSSVAFYN